MNTTDNGKHAFLQKPVAILAAWLLALCLALSLNGCAASEQPSDTKESPAVEASEGDQGTNENADTGKQDTNSTTTDSRKADANSAKSDKTTSNTASSDQAKQEKATSDKGDSKAKATSDSKDKTNSTSTSGSSSKPSKSSSSASSSSSSKPAASEKVSVSVYVDASKASSLGYPSCMASKTVSLNKGASVYDALKATGVRVGGSSSYVSSINGLAEKALGGTSGWMYSVNGSTPMKPAGVYKLNSGDKVRWYYVESW